MSSTPAVPASRGAALSARRLRVLAPILGILAAAMVMVYGIVLNAPGGGVFTFLPAFIPAIVLAFAVGDPPKGHPGRTLLLAMIPAAMGLLTATLVFGSYPQSVGVTTWWWVVGGLLSAAPFVVVGLVAGRQARR